MDKIVPMFGQALGGRVGGPNPILRVERELFHIGNRIYIVNAKESVRRNIGMLLSQGLRVR